MGNDSSTKQAHSQHKKESGGTATITQTPTATIVSADNTDATVHFTAQQANTDGDANTASGVSSPKAPQTQKMISPPVNISDILIEFDSELKRDDNSYSINIVDSSEESLRQIGIYDENGVTDISKLMERISQANDNTNKNSFDAVIHPESYMMNSHKTDAKYETNQFYYVNDSESELEEDDSKDNTVDKEQLQLILESTQSKPKTINLTLKKRIIGKWYYDETLGNGGFSWVKKGINIKNKNEIVAIKFLDKSSKHESVTKKVVQNEIDCLEKLDHPNLISLIAYNLHADYQQSNSDKTIKVIAFVLEYAQHGELTELLSRIGAFHEKLARTYFVQLISAIEHCHSKGIIHRDMKPQNILLNSQYNAKICDFGLSKVE